MPPTGETPWLPGGLKLGDLTCALALLTAAISVMHRCSIRKPVLNLITPAFLFYTVVVILLPPLGIILYAAPIDWYFGDLRWILMIGIFFAFMEVYKRDLMQRFDKHCYTFIWVMALAQLPFLLSQIGMDILELQPSYLLELWYPGGEGGYGNYGHHKSRYAAGMTHASDLALVGGIAFVVGGLKGKRAGWNSALLFLFGLLLILAAGTRAMIFGAPAATIVLLTLLNLSGGRIKITQIKTAIFGITGASLVGGLAYYFNIGRIASSDRLSSVFHWVSGQVTLNDIAMRGGARWSLPIHEAWSDWSCFGTLVNPRHAMAYFPPMDSYFVFAFVQAGPFIIIPFLIVIGLLIRQGMNLLLRDNHAGAVPVGIGVVLIISAITQNTMTGLAARVFLTIAVGSLSFFKKPDLVYNTDMSPSD
jgi:hypothetical protein